jgi:hypothetical protein
MLACLVPKQHNHYLALNNGCAANIGNSLEYDRMAVIN